MIKFSSESGFKALSYIMTVVFILLILYPLFYIISNSMKDNSKIYDIPPSIIPDQAQSVSIVIDYQDLSELTEEALLDSLLQDAALTMFSTVVDFPKDSIYEIKLYGVMGDKTVFYSRAHRMKLELQRDFGVYSQSAINKKVLLYKDRYSRAMDKIGYEFSPDGLDISYSLSTNQNNHIEMGIRENLNGDFSISGAYSKSILKTNNWLLLESYGYYYQLPSYVYSNNERISQLSFFAFMLNTIIVITWAVVTQVVLGTMSAFPISRMLPKRWSKAVMMYFLATMMIPFVSIMIPQFTMFKQMGFYNNYEALLLPFLLPFGFFIYLFKGFFDQLPNSLFEAAKIDGAGNWFMYTRICLPLSKPIISLVALQTFLANWNDFLWAWMVTESQELWTLNVALYSLSKNMALKQNFIMGLSILTIIPVLLMTILFSNNIKQSIASTGIKG